MSLHWLSTAAGHRGLAGPVAEWSSYRSCAQNYQVGASLVLIAIRPVPVQNGYACGGKGLRLGGGRVA